MKKYLALAIIIILVFTSACSTGTMGRVEPMDFGRGKLKALPEYNADDKNQWQMDLRSYDLSSLNLENRLKDLKYADFDTATKWPEKLPEGFDPQKIMELGKNPGLGVRSLHEMCITGKGVGIAIIDQTLLTDHVEYKDNLRHYEEIHNKGEIAEMHGAAVASIAVGKTIGVAPGASLYHIALTPGKVVKGKFELNLQFLAEGIDRVIEINDSLQGNEKIRVISVSLGWTSKQKGYKELAAALERAKENGIFVVSCAIEDTYGFKFDGLGREIMSDPENNKAYRPGLWWEKQYFSGLKDLDDNTLLIPMDSRTTASPTGTSDYVFYRSGGWSWIPPYVAGLYALACQVNPAINPDKFWDMALKTGEVIEVDNNGKTYNFGKIVNPVKLIESLKKQ